MFQRFFDSWSGTHSAISTGTCFVVGAVVAPEIKEWIGLVIQFLTIVSLLATVVLTMVKTMREVQGKRHDKERYEQEKHN